MKIKLLSYEPDSDPSIEGILTNCANMVPSVRGMKGAPSPLSPGNTPLAATCQGAAVIELLDTTTRFIAGTPTKLYEANGNNWTDRSRSSAYSPASDVRWRFAQFGNVALAAVKSDTLQASASTAFSDAASAAPKAAIVETVNQFVFLFDTNESTYGNSQNRWWCSAIGDYTNWTPSIPNQCATGTLVATPGPIVGGKRLGDQIVAYKASSMYIGTYVGPPAVWSFQQVPGGIGAVSHESVVNIGTPEQPQHIFMGRDNFYLFDGARPVPIPNRLRERVFNVELYKAYAYLSMALHDRTRANVYFFYCSSNSITPDKCVVYNYRTGTWGRDDRTVQMVVEYITSGVTYDGLGSSYSTYNDLPNVSYDSFFQASQPIPAIFDTSNTLKTLTGVSATSSITTGDIGDDQQLSMLKRAVPRFTTAPTTCTMTNSYKMASGDALTMDQTVSLVTGKLDVMRDARWHRLQFNFTGDVELGVMDVQLQESSDE